MRKFERLWIFLAAGMVVAVPASARAEWGVGSWGEMVWGDGAPKLPALDSWGILLLVLALALLGTGLLARRRGRPALSVLLVLLVVPTTALAATISLPNTFLNGTIADADEVNANFITLVVESNTQDSRIDALEATDITSINAGTGLIGGGSAGAIDLGVDSAVVQSRVFGQCPPGSAIRVISPSGSVGCEVDDDTNSGGDITEVIAGSGLVGGGTGGAVSLWIGPEAVTSTHLAAGSVGTSEIASDAVTGARIAPDARDTLTVGDSPGADVDCSASGTSVHGVGVSWTAGGDDADCLRAAVNAAALLGVRNVVLLEGTYTTQSSIVMQSGVHLQAARTSAGRARVRIEATAGGFDVVQWTAASNAALTGIEFQNSGGPNVRLVYVSGFAGRGVIRENRFASSFANDDYVVVQDLAWAGAWEEFLIEENSFNNGYPSCASDTGDAHAYLVLRATALNLGALVAVRRNTFVSYSCEKQHILLDAQGSNLDYNLSIEQNQFTWYSQSSGASIRTVGEMPGGTRILNVQGNLFACLTPSPVPVIAEDATFSDRLRISENTFDGCGAVHNLSSAPSCLGNSYLNGSDPVGCETTRPAVGLVQLSGSTTSTLTTVLDSFTAQVPGPGSLLVTIEGQIWFNADATSASSVTAIYYLGLCDTPSSTANCAGTWRDHVYQDADDVSFANATFAFSKTRVVPVSAAGSRTFYVNARTTDANYSVNLYADSRATVTYLPGSLTVTNP